jgi:S-DNA-T family DNA segregation ATPase FtsK/SpoIIIE
VLSSLEPGGPAPHRPESGPRALLLLDDVDAVFAAAGAEYGHALAERLLRIVREGAGTVAVVLAAARLPTQLGAMSALAGSRLLLRAASREEHLLAGGAPNGFDRAVPPGRGELDGVLVQVALASRAAAPPVERSVPLEPLPGLLAVSCRPGRLAAAFGGGPVSRLAADAPSIPTGQVLLGTPDEWQARWSLFKQLAAARPVLFDGCGPAEVRSLLGRSELPPPCSGSPRWLFRPGTPAVRVREASAS